MQDTSLFDQFAPAIRGLSPSDLKDASALKRTFNIERDGDLQVCYAPVEYVNPHARVVIVGITPGLTQMANALAECQRQLARGASAESALYEAKLTAAFSGSMRPALVELLDFVGIHQWLGLQSTSELFGSSQNLLQAESVLRYPIFVGGQNYSGTPNMVRHPVLRGQLLQHLGRAASHWRGAVFVPLGDKVAEALIYLADKGLIDHDRVLAGLPHPSGANSERIAYFLNKKRRQDLSVKTDPDKLDAARHALIKRVAALS